MTLRHNPLLSDIPAHKTKFEAGDRVLARVSVALNASQYRNLKRAITKFAGADVRVLIVNCLQTVIVHVDRVTEKRSQLAGPTDSAYHDPAVGVANLNCSKVELKPDDRLFVFVPRIASEPQRDMIRRWVKEWAGKDIEVIVQEGKF